MNSMFITLFIALLVAINCSCIGVFLLLRGQAMVSDGISHAILPGIVLAFLLGHNTGIVLLSIGAVSAAILLMLCIRFLKQQVHLSHGAALGISFSTFFSFGILLLTVYAKEVDLDPGCVFYGELIRAHFDIWVWRGIEMGPRAIYLLMGLLVLNSLFLFFFYHAMVITTFDPDFACALGVHVQRWRDAFNLLTTITIVAILRIVGAPLVLGFLTIPVATASLFTKRIPRTLFYAFMIDVIVSSYGYLLALRLNVSLSGSIITIAGLLFGLIFFLVRFGSKKILAETCVKALLH